MKRRSNITAIIATPLVLAALILAPLSSQRADSAGAVDPYRSAVPAVDVNLLATALRTPTSAQLAALNQFKGTYGGQTSVRWNPFAGSPVLTSVRPS